MGSCIDNIFWKSEDINAKAYKLLSRFTDHYPLIVTLKVETRLDNPKTNNYTFVDYKKLNIECDKVNWDQIHNVQEPEQAIDLLITNIKKITLAST